MPFWLSFFLVCSVLTWQHFEGKKMDDKKDSTSSLAEQLKEKVSQLKRLEQTLQEYQLKCTCGIARDTSIVSEDRLSRRSEHNHKKSQTSTNMSDFIGPDAVSLGKKSEGHTRNKSVGGGQALYIRTTLRKKKENDIQKKKKKGGDTYVVLYVTLKKREWHRCGAIPFEAAVATGAKQLNLGDNEKQEEERSSGKGQERRAKGQRDEQ
ncbi:hypothetical protein RFI_16961 [Reticulomyxa filosa]|uniref:Uncharacterized protein n=1 Tax=Reticulomyxa filosa TaxID=46433 RepID=X6N2D2_RETFI|nr:hypothetical protein RFI_16961 [Reticulomyxa filosa]|eukprot:ETO20256.1 hypothetical protein RFI_16961 [Reticulomyxa filosa]